MGITRIIDDSGFTIGYRRTNISTVITRNFRTNKRGKQRRAAALYLVPTMHHTAALPLVTTNNVKANGTVLTAFTLKTRKIRVNAHFTLARRDSTRRGFGRLYLGLGRNSAGLLLGGLSPAHLIGKRFAATIRRTRTHKTSTRRVGRLLKGNHSGGNVFRKGLRRNRLRVKRITSLFHRVRAISRIVGRVVRSFHGKVRGVRLTL